MIDENLQNIGEVIIRLCWMAKINKKNDQDCERKERDEFESDDDDCNPYDE